MSVSRIVKAHFCKTTTVICLLPHLNYLHVCMCLERCFVYSEMKKARDSWRCWQSMPSHSITAGDLKLHLHFNKDSFWTSSTWRLAVFEPGVRDSFFFSLFFFFFSNTNKCPSSPHWKSQCHVDSVCANPLMATGGRPKFCRSMWAYYENTVCLFIT